MYDLLCVGNVTMDTIVSATGTRVVAGGAVNYGAHAARALQLRTAVVTRLARRDYDVVRELESIGVTAKVTYTKETTALRLDYPTGRPDDRVVAVTANAGAITPEEVEGIEARSVVVGPSFFGEVAAEVLQLLSRQGASVAVDAQGFVRRVRDGHLFNGSWPERREVLPLVSILKADASEARCMTGESNLLDAARRLHGEGPREVLLTSEKGVLVFDGRRRFEAPFLSGTPEGRSGRGDTCLAAYAGRRIVDPPERAVVWAAAITSMKMEVEGPFRGSFASVQRFVAERYSSLSAG